VLSSYTQPSKPELECIFLMVQFGMSKWLIIIVKILLPIAVVVSIAAFACTIFLVTHPESEWARSFPLLRDSVSAISTAAMVIATLFLAWVTFMIVNSDRDRDQRDRTSAYFDEVIKWAEEIRRCSLKPTSESLEALRAGTDEEYAIVGEDVKSSSFFARAATWELREIEILESEHRLLLSRGEYLKVMCDRLGSHFAEALDVTATALANHVKLLGKCISEYGDITDFNSVTLNARTNNLVAASENNKILQNHTIKLINEVTNSKAQLIVS
jgi:hypothetical protein